MTQKTNDFKVPYISDKKLRDIASDFLNEHNPTQEIPVPIERIVEYDLGIKIIPSIDLKRIWGWDGYINSTLDTIYIDNYCYENYNERTVFTVAHELAHVILHEDYYKGLGIDDEQSFLSHQDDKNMIRVEAQAYAFAGYLLLPSDSFNARFEDMLKDFANVDAEDLGFIMRGLVEEYGVSEMCVYKQVKREFPDILKAIETP